MGQVWSKEKAWKWYNEHNWIRGCNFMGSDCANRIDQWQELGFEERIQTAEEELKLAYTAIKTLGGQVEKSVDYVIPGTEVAHRLIFIKKIKETPKKYPRAFAKIKKNPL